MALPASWVDRIFSELQLAYGHRFLSQWPGVEVDVIKADWARKLDGFEAHPEAIRYALDNVPADQPINALQFRDLARRSPAKPMPSLPAPEVNKEAAAKALASASKAFRGSVDRLDPIRNLMQRELDGDKRLTKFQREFWRKALRSELLLKGIDTATPFDSPDLRAALSKGGAAPTKRETEQPAREMEVPA